MHEKILSRFTENSFTIHIKRNHFQLNLALKESVSDITELNIFFTNLTEMHSFFNRSFGRSNELRECQASTTSTDADGLPFFTYKRHFPCFKHNLIIHTLIRFSQSQHIQMRFVVFSRTIAERKLCSFIAPYI